MALGDNFIPNIEKKTGKSTKDFVALAVKKGFSDPATKPGVMIAWLKEKFGLGHGHAMAMTHQAGQGQNREHLPHNGPGARDC